MATGSRTSQGFPSVLLLLLVLVIVPTAGVVWFMSEALRNERAAVRQTLIAAWEAQLAVSAGQVEVLWQMRRQRLDAIEAEDNPALAFARAIREDIADSLIIRDASQRVLYPADPAFDADVADNDSPAWRDAERLEFTEDRYEEASRKYAEISRVAGDPHEAARALLAQARSLGKAGRKDEAARIITVELTNDRFRNARDGGGRLVVPQALLLTVYWQDDLTGDEDSVAADLLIQWINDYGEPRMPVAQRRFLMRQLRERYPALSPTETMAAEELADRYLKSSTGFQATDHLSATALPDIWQMSSADGRVTALYRQATIAATVHAIPIIEASGGPVELELLPPGSASDSPLVTHSLTGDLSGWRMALHLVDAQAIDAAADEEIAANLWVGALLIAAVVIVATLIARVLSRQMRLARLKSDLVSTVTHELRTPLASTRLLVDTLLSSERLDEPKTREYLELIAGENQRLGRLIEDFLSFSRLERNKQTFEKKLVDPSDIVDAASRSVRGRLDGNDCRFDVDVEKDLPQIFADPDALTTVLINLLDNACKYTPEGEVITLRAGRENGYVVFAVEDHGIGLSRRAARRVFDRFYRVDDSLSRSKGGMGLGLAIVKFIVDAHDGEVGVDSRPGEGSTFTLRMRAAA